MNLLREKLRCTPMGAGLRFHTESRSSSTTWQQDNRRVIGEGGVSAEDSTVNYFVQDLGGEVVDSSLNFAGNAVDGSLNAITAAGGALVRGFDQALNFAGDTVNRSLQTVDRTTDSAFAFGGDALYGALQFGSLAMRENADLAGASMDYSAQAARGAQTMARESLGIANDALINSMLYGTRVTDMAFSGLNDTQNLVKDAYADAKGRGAMTDKILIGAVLAVAVVAALAVQK